MPLIRINDIGTVAQLGLWCMNEDISSFGVWTDEATKLYQSEARRREYVCVRALMCEMLGDNEIPTITHNADGKPLLSDGRLISISHTRGFCAVMLSSSCQVAVDIEYVSERVGRIAHMFLRHDEFAKDTTSQLLHWCAKETIYKLFSSDRLRYEEMRVSQFDVHRKGCLAVENLKRSLVVHVCYEVTPDYVLTYAVK